MALTASLKHQVAGHRFRRWVGFPGQQIQAQEGRCRIKIFFTIQVNEAVVAPVIVLDVIDHLVSLATWHRGTVLNFRQPIDMGRTILVVGVFHITDKGDFDARLGGVTA